MINLSKILIMELMPLFEGMVDSMIYKIKDEVLKKQWQDVFDKAKQVFSNRMDYVNWFFDKTLSISSYIVKDADNILDKFKEFYDLNIQSINKISIIKYNSVQGAIKSMYDARELYFEKLYKDVIPIEKTKKATELLVCSDPNFIWFDLHTKSCKEEHYAMGHCGEDETGDTLWSLREKIFVGNKLIGYKPHVTATYHKTDKRLSQVKGRENTKPVEKYHKFIKELLYAGLVEDFGGGTYKPEEDFGWGEFSKEEIKQTVKNKIKNNKVIPKYLINTILSLKLFYLIKNNKLKQNKETLKALEDSFIHLCSGGDIEAVKFLLEIGINVHVKYNEALDEACFNGHIEVVKLLLEAGADVHTNNDESFRWASEKGHTEIVKLLLEAGANVHAEDDYALRWASQNGHTKVVKLLLEAGADIHADNDYAFRFASQNGHTEIVKLLLEAGADVHARNDLALVWASQRGYTETVKLLLEAGANVHAEDDYALRRASKLGHVEVVKLLLEAGANIHARDDEALREASRYGWAKTVKLLLEAGADVHAEDNKALRLASKFGDTEIVKLLKQYMKNEK